MFGYVRVYSDELLVREFEEYKAVYCGLCRRMGKEYSLFSRLILSYDCTFYAMLLLSLNGTCPGYEKKHCRCNPIKKCSYIKGGEEALSKASALSVVSSYFKIVDNIYDSKGIKKLIYKMVKPIFRHWLNKAKKNYPYIFDAVSEMSENQLKAENNSDCHIDMAADPTATMLKKILSYEATTKSQSVVLEEMGYNLGRWIYLIDAIDDYDKDNKKGGFNPFLSYDGNENIRDYCNQVLNMSLSRLYRAWELLDVTLYRGIINNILLKGLATKQKEILNMEGK